MKNVGSKNVGGILTLAKASRVSAAANLGEFESLTFQTKYGSTRWGGKCDLHSHEPLKGHERSAM